VGGAQDVDVVVALKELPPRDHLPEHHAERELIGAPVELGAVHLLGRHVLHLALEQARGRPRRAIGRLRDAEVHHLGDAVGAHHDVLRDHVAVHDVEGLALEVGGLVRVIERVRGVVDDERGDVDRHLLAGALGHALQPREVVAADVLHRDEVRPVLQPHLVDAHDVRVVERGGDAGLVEELVHEVLLRREVGQEGLQDDEAIEAGDAGLAREEDLAHAAHGEAPDDLVPPEDELGGRRRRLGRGAGGDHAASAVAIAPRPPRRGLVSQKVGQARDGCASLHRPRRSMGAMRSSRLLLAALAASLVVTPALAAGKGKDKDPK
jgi:hypothetical protein